MEREPPRAAHLHRAPENVLKVLPLVVGRARLAQARYLRMFLQEPLQQGRPATVQPADEHEVVLATRRRVCRPRY